MILQAKHRQMQSLCILPERQGEEPGSTVASSLSSMLATPSAKVPAQTSRTSALTCQVWQLIRLMTVHKYSILAQRPATGPSQIRFADSDNLKLSAHLKRARSLLVNSYAITAQANGCKRTAIAVLPDQAIHDPLREGSKVQDTLEVDRSTIACACDGCHLQGEVHLTLCI